MQNSILQLVQYCVHNVKTGRWLDSSGHVGIGAKVAGAWQTPMVGRDGINSRQPEVLVKGIHWRHAGQLVSLEKLLKMCGQS